MTTDAGIRLIVGLGNPEPEYAGTRHNAGAWFADAVARAARARFAAERRFYGEVARARVNGNEIWLLKPTTYMNRSGQSVAALALFYKIVPAQILVAHDELDLEPGVIRLKLGGGTAGHNGLKDTQARLATADFWRLRIGIGHPRTRELAQDVADFVLHRASSEDQKAIDTAIERAQDIVALLADGCFDAAMLRLHTRVEP